MASGTTADEIRRDYPGLAIEDLQACLAYGSEMSRERYGDIPLENSMRRQLDENLGEARRHVRRVTTM